MKSCEEQSILTIFDIREVLVDALNETRSSIACMMSIFIID